MLTIGDFARLGQVSPRMLRHYDELGLLRPERVDPATGCVAHYDEPDDDGRVTVHAGFDLGDQVLDGDGDVEVVDLPVVEVASVVHRGPMDTVVPVYEALVRWIEDCGYQLAGRSRELYHEWHADDPPANVTELQMPLRR